MLQNLKVISNFVRNGHCESFAERFPFIRVMTEENFFFECDAYDLIIPCFEQEQSEIYLLEKVVLKLIQLNVRTRKYLKSSASRMQMEVSP